MGQFELASLRGHYSCMPLRLGGNSWHVNGPGSPQPSRPSGLDIRKTTPVRDRFH